MKLTCFETVELSDIGMKRKNNEDACLRLPEKGVYCVADGMGGVVGGDLASAAIIDRLRKVFGESAPAEPESFAGNVALFRQAANAASKWIKDFADEKVIGQMGSTLVAIVFDPDNPRRAVALHAGDSRLYRYRNGQLQLLTADHTAAAALAAKLGRDVAQIPNKFHNELVRAVGLAESVELERTMVEVASGDLFLLCSDGLTRMMPEEAISAALKSTSGAPLDQVAKTLISGANEAGGKDNVTVVLTRMGDLSGFSEVLEPVDLDAPQTLAAAAGLEGDTLVLTKLRPGHTPDSSEAMRGHTPQSNDAAWMQGDTPNDDHSARMRGDTPQTDDVVATQGDTPSSDCPAQMRGDTPRTEDAPSPPTSPTAQPASPPRPVVEKKESPIKQENPAKEEKSGSRNGIVIGAVLAIAAVAGVYLHFRGGSRSPEANDGGQTPGAAPVSAAARGASPSQSTAPQPSQANAPIQAKPEPQTVTRTEVVNVQSDPPGAEVWVESQLKGKTPLDLRLPVGQASVTLKVNGLKDRTESLIVASAKANGLNVAFAYGGLVIQSKPAGAEVLQNGIVFGHTPYAAKMVPPGLYNWQLTAAGCHATNVSVEVTDHQTNQVTVPLKKEQGVLQLTGDLAGITASVDGGSPGRLPMSVWEDADMDHAVRAEYKGAVQTRGVRIKGGQTTVVPFTFNLEPTPPLRWTNDFLGMVFVEVPGAGAWAATQRVTPEQFSRVMAGVPNTAKESQDNGQRYVANLTGALTKDFAAKLNGIKIGGERPDEIKRYHFALPTTNQWMQIFANADRLGIQITNLRADKEWCLDGNSWFMAGYVLQGTNFNPEPGYKALNPGDQPKPFALRLVLVP